MSPDLGFEEKHAFARRTFQTDYRAGFFQPKGEFYYLIFSGPAEPKFCDILRQKFANFFCKIERDKERHDAGVLTVVGLRIIRPGCKSWPLSRIRLGYEVATQRRNSDFSGEVWARFLREIVTHIGDVSLK